MERPETRFNEAAAERRGIRLCGVTRQSTREWKLQ